MRLLLLSDINSSHTQKWALGLASAGFKVGIFSLSPAVNDWFSIKQIEFLNFDNVGDKLKSSRSFFKIRYLNSLKHLRKVIESFKPDVLHAHYATSYGLLGALSGFKPLLISVWGSDVFEFPSKSVFHKELLRYNLNHAERIFSSSNVMAEETRKLTRRPVYVIPFGVDTELFRPSIEKNLSGNEIIIGTVKALEKIYGIDILIRGFRIVADNNPDLKLKLLIVGGGSQLSALQNLAQKQSLTGRVTFAGKVMHQDLPAYYNRIDIFANLSRQESFGVSVLEAMSCAGVVVVSYVGGLPELVKDGETGLIVEPENEEAVAAAFQRLLDDKQLASRLGTKAREQVKDQFEWSKSVDTMIRNYRDVLART